MRVASPMQEVAHLLTAMQLTGEQLPVLLKQRAHGPSHPLEHVGQNLSDICQTSAVNAIHATPDVSLLAALLHILL